jgi:hypothetical protein
MGCPEATVPDQSTKRLYMKRHWIFFLAAFCLSLVQPIFAQTSIATSALPRLVRFGGAVSEGPQRQSAAWRA